MNIIHPTQVRICSPSCLQNLYFFLVLSLPGWNGFSCSCNIISISLAKNGKKGKVQPLKLLLLLFILLQSAHCISPMARLVRTFVLFLVRAFSLCCCSHCWLIPMVPRRCSTSPLFHRFTVLPACCEMHQYYRHHIAHCLLHSFKMNMSGERWLLF